jgi:transcriptional regulator with PAS, ATPase and Fis domain
VLFRSFNETETIKNQIDKLTGMEDFIVFDNILGSSEQIAGVKNKILKISQANSTVLITGESGVGKEIFARAIHGVSYRKDKPFVAVNCGALPENFIESELFGCTKNPFTGTDYIGKFQCADGGTIFLDEIGELPVFMQVKLLRVLQDLEVTPVGSNKPVKLDVRVIAATNKALEELTAKGGFREDLYYKLSVIPIEIPPLRERVEDIKVIIYYYLNKYSKMINKKFVGLDSDVWKYLCRYDWPGNVRELQNVVEFMVNILDSSGIITIDNIPQRIREKGETLVDVITNESLNLKNIEVDTIKKALKIYSSSKKGKQAAADALGIGIATLYRKIDEHNLLK